MNNLKQTQNFLKSKKLIERIIKKTNLNKKDLVLEIGSGNGIITDELSKTVNNVIALEADKNLYNNLIKSKKINVDYINKDILKYDLPKKENYKVFSSIPFNITSNIIRKLTNNLYNLPADIYLIVQEEAAKKYLGIPYQKYEGLKASLIKGLFDIRILHKFKREDFTPKPKVDTVLIHFKKKKDININDFNEYQDFISFFYLNSQIPTLKKQLSLLFSAKQIKRLSKDLNFNLSDNISKLTYEQWKGIFEYSKIGLEKNKKEKYKGAFKKITKRNENLKKQNKSNYRKNKPPRIT